MAENIQEEIENKIIDKITASASGRLIVFKPEQSKQGADLVIERRGKYKEESFYFKVNSFISSKKNDVFVKDFLQDEFRADKNFYLLFVCFDEILQKINDRVWLVPSLQFKDIADYTKSPDGKKILKFQASVDIKDKNRYSKYSVKIKELGKLLINAFESGRIDFKEADFQDNKAINLEGLKEFISEARANTYASNATFADNPRLLASRQLEFQKGDYFYRDIYFSEKKKFIGQEIVYKNNKPAWGMNYIGSAIDKNTEKFLKDSLLRLARKCRFGEACEFEKREYKYQNTGHGELDDFSGQEYVFLEGKNIYKLNYQGGLL